VKSELARLPALCREILTKILTKLIMARLGMKASAEGPAQVKVLEPTEAGGGVGATAKAHWPNQAVKVKAAMAPV
jgi:hypothetical protein